MRAIAIDGGDAKRDLCIKMGAEEFIDFTKEKDVPAKIKEIADGIGAHGVLVTAYQAYNGKLTISHPHPADGTQANTAADSIKYIGDRIGGRIMAIALPPAGTITLGTDPNFFAFKNLKIIGTLVGTMQDTAATLDYARRGLLKSICEVRGMSQMPESAQQLRRGEVAGRIVIDFNKD